MQARVWCSQGTAQANGAMQAGAGGAEAERAPSPVEMAPETPAAAPAISHTELEGVRTAPPCCHLWSTLWPRPSTKLLVTKSSQDVLQTLHSG